jgi:hypothetical protein
MADTVRRPRRARPTPLVFCALAGLALVVGNGVARQAPPSDAPSAPTPATPVPATPTGLPAPGPAPADPPPPVPTAATIAPTTQVVAPPGAQRFTFAIDPKTPARDLLPTAPKPRASARPVLADDLAQVPEAEFQAAAAKELPAAEATRQTAHTIAKVNHLNGRRPEGFLEALRGERPDLAGLPFAMGDECRTKGERSRQFTLAVATVRRALQTDTPRQGALIGGLTGPATGSLGIPAPTAPVNGLAPPPGGSPGSGPGGPGQPQATAPVPTGDNSAEGFWERYQAACAQEDRALPRADRALAEHVTLARVAALMQVLAPESPDLRLGLVRYLAGVPHAEATRALARLAVFAQEEEVRRAAVDALKVRRERDYTDVLVRGLRYPWPSVARNAADAAVRLERSDLLPELVALLEEPDPRAPVVREVNGAKAAVVRELVRVNHHRSCLLCHAPGNAGGVSPEALTAAVPVAGEPLPSTADGYRATSPDLLVRIDVTYLRQDFSVRQPVADAAPWPELQRFDYLVRERALSEGEAAAFREGLEPKGPGRLSPYRRAALAALRELTGRDAEPTAEAWRRLMDLPAPPRKPAAGG